MILEGCGSSYIYSQHLGGIGRQISEFKGNLVYSVSPSSASATQRNLVAKQTNK